MAGGGKPESQLFQLLTDLLEEVSAQRIVSSPPSSVVTSVTPYAVRRKLFGDDRGLKHRLASGSRRSM